MEIPRNLAELQELALAALLTRHLGRRVTVAETRLLVGRAVRRMLAEVLEVGLAAPFSADDLDALLRAARETAVDAAASCVGQQAPWWTTPRAFTVQGLSPSSEWMLEADAGGDPAMVRLRLKPASGVWFSGLPRLVVEFLEGDLEEPGGSWRRFYLQGHGQTSSAPTDHAELTARVHAQLLSDATKARVEVGDAQERLRRTEGAVLGALIGWTVIGRELEFVEINRLIGVAWYAIRTSVAACTVGAAWSASCPFTVPGHPLGDVWTVQGYPGAAAGWLRVSVVPADPEQWPEQLGILVAEAPREAFAIPGRFWRNVYLLRSDEA